MHAMMDAGGGAVSSSLLTTTADELKTLADTAIANDEAELQAALNAIQDNCFRGGHNEQATRQACDALAQQLRDMVNQMGEVTKNSIAKNCDYAEKIEREVSPGWRNVVDQLTAVREEMNAMKIDSWQGTASDAYHTKIGKQMNDANKHIGLSQNAKGSIDAVALVQRGITDQAYSALLSAISGGSSSANRAPASFTKESWFNRQANDLEFSFEFYSRTAAMLNACAPQQSVLNELAGGNPWRPTSTGIADQLGVAISEARSDHDIATDQYDSTVDKVGDQYKSDLDESGRQIQR